MALSYRCPRCEVVLNPSGDVVLNGRTGTRRGLFLFSPKPGDFDYRISPGVEVLPGDIWEFCCPVCQHNLTAPESKTLAILKMEDEKGHHIVIFSKVAGEHATFALDEEGVKSFGEDTQNYIDISIQRHYW